MSKVRQRKDFEVRIRRSIPQSRIVVLRINCGPDLKFVAESDGGDLIATCDSAKRLADWAFENGAWKVVYDYDLKLSDDEM